MEYIDDRGVISCIGRILFPTQKKDCFYNMHTSVYAY